MKNLLRMLLRLALFSIILIVPLSAGAEPQPYQLSKSGDYRVESVFCVENVGSRTATDISLEIQYANPYITKLMPYSTILNTLYEPQPVEVKTDAKGNQTGRYEIARLLPGEKQIIRVLHDYRVSLIDYTIDPARIEPYAQFQPAVLQPYLTPSPGIESDHPLIQAKAREVVGRETNPFKKAKKIFTFVNEYMTYSEEKFGTNEGKESEYGALYALQTGKGVCEDYADLMVALLRATGVPARTVSGWTGEISGKSIKLIDANTTFLPGHMWLEYYLPGYGWIPADPTFTYTVNNVRQVEYSRLTGIRQPSFVDSCEMAGHAVSYSFRGDVDVNTNVTIYKLGVDGVMPLPVEGTQAPLLYLEDIPLIFDVNPVIENGRTLVPMRGIFQALGAAVEWDGVTQRIVAMSPERKVELQIGQTQAWVNGELRTLDVSPCILDSRTMIPLRFVGEALGCQVDWDGNLRTINLRFH